MNTTFNYIYTLSGVCNHLVYIGASSDPERRINEHMIELKRGDHYNSTLQVSWNIFGNRNLTFHILEAVPADTNIQTKEKKWIDKVSKDDGLVLCNQRYGGGNNTYGYELNPETKRKQSEAKLGKSIPLEKTKAKDYTFISPDGREIRCKGLKSLCERFQLNLGHMCRVAKGLLRQHKGWSRAV